MFVFIVCSFMDMYIVTHNDTYNQAVLARLNNRANDYRIASPEKKERRWDH